MALTIIAGIYKKRKLLKCNHQNIKPTKNIVRSAIFNCIQNNIKNANFLDLFAGSGIIGIEAISREAHWVYFVEKEKEITKTILKNLKKLEIHNAKVINSDYQKAIIFFKKNKISFDIIMIDPPYTYQKDKYVYIINLLCKNKILKKETILILESVNFKITDKFFQNNFFIIKQKKYGKSLLTILKKKK